MQITKIFTFDAAHRLSNYEGKCAHIHGHTYKLEVSVVGSVDSLGMVIDFGDLKQILKEVIEDSFDHKTLLKCGDPLNEQIAEKFPDKDWVVWLPYNPTAENLAKDFLQRIKKRLTEYENLQVSRIKLWETPNSFVEIKP